MCVFIYTTGCVWILGCRSGSRLQVPGKHSALAAEVGAESPGWEAVMCNESCLALYWGKLWVFLFIHNQMYGYQECRAFTRVLLIPWEVAKFTLLISTVLNGNLSCLDCPWLRALFETQSKDKSLFLHRCGCEAKSVSITNWMCFRWERIRSNYKREKGIINGQFLVKAMWKEFSKAIASLTNMECKHNHSKAPL